MLSSRLLPRIIGTLRNYRARLYDEYLALKLSGRHGYRVWRSVKKIPGLLVSPHQELWLYQSALSLPDKAVIVEIGSFKGRSTASLAYGCLGTKKLVYAIDTFNGNDHDFATRDYLDEFSENIRSRGLEPYVRPIVNTSREVAATWRQEIDMLFVDGSHDYKDVLDDFYGFFPHVKPNGLVAFHDVGEDWGGWDGPLAAWENVISHHLVSTGCCSTLAYGYKPSEEPTSGRQL